MKFIFYSPIHFEKWDWRNSVEKGIGGSETSHVEMAWRLAARGHEVITYAPVPSDCPGSWRGTVWKPLEEVDFKLEGVWILYRCPEAIDKFEAFHPNQRLWFLMQDWDYPTWTEEHFQKLDKVITLCKWHGRDVLKAHPAIGRKMWITSNGIKGDLIAQIEAENIPRNPKKIVFASSPDRGLRYLLKCFLRAEEFDADLELHAFYGFNNLDKLIANQKQAYGFSHFEKEKDQIEKMAAKSKRVHLRGRLTQQDLYREWMSAGMWVYPTNFLETSCITSMEAQACGAIPIVHPVGALAENVQFGIGIDGDPYSDKLIQARFTGEILRLAGNPELRSQIRAQMVPWARARFDWERMVDQWECAALEVPYESEFPAQLEDSCFTVKK